MKYEYKAVMIGGATVKFQSDRRPSRILDTDSRLIVTDDVIINVDQMSYLFARSLKEDE